jgi:PASTA domain-containing protein
MSAEEQRLADLLKRAVPEPPRELSADEVTMRHISRPREARSAWGLPSLAAAAMLIVGVGVGVAAHQWSSSVPSTPRSPFAPAASQGAGQPAPSRSSLPSPGCPPPHSTPAVTMPNVIGDTAPAAIRAIQTAGFAVSVVAGKPPAGQPVPAGTVYEQSPARGSVLMAGATVNLYVAADSGSPAPSPKASSAEAPSTVAPSAVASPAVSPSAVAPPAVSPPASPSAARPVPPCAAPSPSASPTAR